MKKIFLMVFIIFSTNSISQQKYIELTPEGLQFLNTEKEYIVIPFKGEKQDEIYKKLLITVNKIYVSGKEVLNKVEPKSVFINGFQPEIIKFKRGRNLTYYYDINYAIDFLIKDEKLRINRPKILSMIRGANTLKISKGKSFWKSIETIFDKQGKERVKFSKQSIEDFFNKLLNDILKEMNNGDDDW